MQPNTTNKASNYIYQFRNNQEPQTQSFANVTKDQIIQNKVDLNLYLNFQQFLRKSQYHYGNYSKYLDKQVSKQQIVNQVIKYLDYIKQTISPLPSDFYQRLLFLFDVFNANKVLITNYFILHWTMRNSTGPKMFQLVLTYIKQRFDVKQFVTFNWNHLVKLSFHCCGWFSNDDWKNLVENAENFNNVKELWFGKHNCDLFLVYNRIRVINEGDLQKFKSLKWINLQKNPLNVESQQLLKKIKLMNCRRAIFYDHYQ